MRILIVLIFGSFICSPFYAQPSTEVYASNLEFDEEEFHFENIQNLSNNKGYDNQPHFLNNDTILYARNNNGQTDIASHSFSNQAWRYVNKPTSGGEYSPQTIPEDNTIVAVRLDPDGLQRLYVYDNSDGNSSLLFSDLKVAYYTFLNRNEILASVIRLNQLDLVRANNQTGETIDLVTNSGRCLQKIPNSEMYSYTIVNEQKNFDLYQFDPESNESYFVCQLPVGVQDYVWYEDYKIIIGSGSQLFVNDLFGNGDWNPIADFKEENLQNITRLALSPDHKKLVFVAEPVKE